MSKLTKQAVKDLEKPEKGQAFLWDGELSVNGGEKMCQMAA